MARTSVASTIDRIRRRLRSGERTEGNSLATTISSSATTAVVLTSDLSDALEIGSEISIGSEIMLVTALNAGTKTLTVVRGWLDSEPENHTAGDLVYIDPRFHGFDILEAMRSELDSWGPQLYRVLGDTLAVAAGAESHELPATMADLYGLIDVRVSPPTGSSSTSWPIAEYHLQRGSTAWDGATTSGHRIRFYNGFGTGSVFVQAAVPFDPDEMVVTADLVADVGLSRGLVELLELGTKLRLIGDDAEDEASRASQNQSRMDEDGPPTIQGRQFTAEMYRRRKNEEITRLLHKYPIRMT